MRSAPQLRPTSHAQASLAGFWDGSSRSLLPPKVRLPAARLHRGNRQGTRASKSRGATTSGATDALRAAMRNGVPMKRAAEASRGVENRVRTAIAAPAASAVRKASDARRAAGGQRVAAGRTASVVPRVNVPQGAPRASARNGVLKVSVEIDGRRAKALLRHGVTHVRRASRSPANRALMSNFRRLSAKEKQAAAAVHAATASAAPSSQAMLPHREPRLPMSRQATP